MAFSDAPAKPMVFVELTPLLCFLRARRLLLTIPLNVSADEVLFVRAAMIISAAKVSHAKSFKVLIITRLV